jgi:hypothetical protein
LCSGGGLRIQEALDLTELDLDPRRGSVLVRRGKGGRWREVGMDDWGFEQLEPWRRCVASPRRPACAVASSRTSCATRTRSSSPAKAYR